MDIGDFIDFYHILGLRHGDFSTKHLFPLIEDAVCYPVRSHTLMYSWMVFRNYPSVIAAEVKADDD